MVAVFAMKLLSGVALMWLLMPRREVTDGFFRIQMLVVLGLSVLATMAIDDATVGIVGQGVSSPSEDSAAREILPWLRGAFVGIAVTAYVGHIVWKLGRRQPGFVTIMLIATSSVAVTVLRGTFAIGSEAGWRVVSSDLASAGVLGAMLTGMLLGHWYLTTPTMAIRPLFWFAGAAVVAGGLRLLVSGLSISVNGWPAAGGTHGLWLVMRVIGGALVPIIVGVMVFRILKYRNTQSATGVLFAGLILVFMGEMAAALLERDLRIAY